ncbi:MAG: hypothetical protein IPL49_11200 [Saprospirales bacterium]|nr:hypothetical protein [Saprospirales bacterium]
MTKPEFIQSLLPKNLFWSYDTREEQSIPDEVVIEQVLLYGDVPDLTQLFHLWDKKLIQKIWEEQLLPHERHRKINYYLGVFFFQIPHINNFLNKHIRAYPRLERLRLLAAGDPESPYRAG